MSRIIELLNHARDERDADTASPQPRPVLPFAPDKINRAKPAPGRSAAASPPPPHAPTVSHPPPPPPVPTSVAAEAAQLFARLHPLLDERGALVLHLASAQAGEGTSTVAWALATHVASLRRYHVLLLDAATQRGPAERSLAGAKDGGADPGAVVQAGGSGWLGRAALGGANAEGDPSVFEVSDLYEQLRADWPVIIVDAPPILERAEMVSLARKSDGVLLVVRAAQPSHEPLVRARDLVEASGAQILGVVLNRYESHIPGFIERRM